MYKIIKVSIIVIALTPIAHLYGIRLNLSSSVPVGIWRLKPGPVKKGEFILFCPEDNSYSQLAKQRGYFQPGWCPGNFRALIKKVVAVQGYEVQVSNHVEINGQAIENSDLLNKDHTGNALIKAFNSSRLKKNELFALGTSEDSFDSR